MKRSNIAIWHSPKPLSYIYFSITGTRNNNYWSFLDVIENGNTPSTFACSKSTIETLGQGVKYAQN